jgi:hypothetical protein
MNCPYCHIDTVIGLYIFRDGKEHVAERCPVCDWNPNPGHPWLSKPDNWIELPVLKSFLDDSEPCAVKGCKNKGTQLHHFFPKYKFEYYDNAPTAYLCYFHHMQEWHAKLTPNMSKKDTD